MKEIIVMKGIPGAGKSTLVNKLRSLNKGIKVFSSDDIRDEFNLEYNDKKALKIYFNRAYDSLKNGNSILLDSTNLKKKYHNKVKELQNIFKTKLTCYYVVTHPFLWEENIVYRMKNKWSNLSYKRVLEIRQKTLGALVYPLPNDFDNTHLTITDIDIPKKDIEVFMSFYNDNKRSFIENTKDFIYKAIDLNIIQSVIPELISIMGYNQHNSHHVLTLDEHTFKVCENLPKTEKWIWAGLLHDLGKLVDGIKQPIEGTDEYSYIGHAGASTEIGVCILNRLGFSKEFMDEVMPIVNLHMYLPYDSTLSKQKQKQFADIYEDLLIFRDADLKAK